MIFCKDHPHKIVKRYCTSHKSLHCKDCAYEKHTDHLKDQKIVIFDTVNKFLEESVTKLLSTVEKIQKIIEDVSQF